MKNYLITLILVLSIPIVYGQVSEPDFPGDAKYGRLFNLNYDKNVANRIYATSFGNHIVVSDDNGDSWSILYSYEDSRTTLRRMVNYGDDHLAYYVSNAADPQENTVFLFDLTSNEVSKQYSPPSTPGADEEWVVEFAIHPDNEDVIFVLERYRIGIENFSIAYYSSNGGDTWTEVYHEIDSENFNIVGLKVAISPDNPEKLFLLRGQGSEGVEGGILISEDAGENWVEHIPNTAFASIAFDPNDADIIYAGTAFTTGASTTVENLYRSFDGGENWEIVDIEWDDFYFESIDHIAFAPNSSDYILVSEANEIAVSLDGGLTWDVNIYDGSPEELYFFAWNASFNPSDNDEILITGNWYPMRTENDGASVDQIENPFFESLYVGLSPDEAHAYYMVQFGVVHLDLNSGVQTPSQVESLEYFGSNTRRFIADPNEQERLYFITGGFLGLDMYVLDSHGTTVESQLLTGSFEQVVEVVSDPANTDNVWVSYDSGTTQIISTNDPGNPTTLPAFGSDRHRPTLFDPADSDHVIVGKGGEIFESFDYGDSWTAITTGLTIDPSSDLVFDIKQNPFQSSELMAATTSGVFKSEDMGQNWFLTSVQTDFNYIFYSELDESVVVAAQRASVPTPASIYISLDNGESWTHITNEMLDYLFAYNLHIAFDGNEVIARLASADVGVVEYRIDLDVLSAVGNIERSEMLTLYPNPTQDYLLISSDENVQFSRGLIYSIDGTVVSKFNNTDKIGVDHLNDGTYILKLVGTDGKMYLKRFVKQ